MYTTSTVPSAFLTNNILSARAKQATESQVKFGIINADLVTKGQEIYETNDHVQKLKRRGHIKRILLFNATFGLASALFGFLLPHANHEYQNYQEDKTKTELVTTLDGDSADTYTEEDLVSLDLMDKLDGREQITTAMFEDLLEQGWVREVEADDPRSDYGTVVLINDQEVATVLTTKLRTMLEDQNIDVVNTPSTKTDSPLNMALRAGIAVAIMNAIGISTFAAVNKVQGRSYEEVTYALPQAMSKLARRIVAHELGIEASTIDIERATKAFSKLEFNYDGENYISVEEWQKSWNIDLAAWVLDTLYRHDGGSLANAGGRESAGNKILTSILKMDMGEKPNDHTEFMKVDEKKELAKKIFDEAIEETKNILDKYPIERFQMVAKLMVEFEGHLLDQDAVALLKGEITEEELMDLYPASRRKKVESFREKVTKNEKKEAEESKTLKRK